MIRNVLLVGLGGMIGSVIRYLIVVGVKQQNFPFGTLIVNVVGSFVIGMLAGLATKNFVSPEMRLFAATGICGGFTTFSAFSAECLHLINDNKYGVALLYILISFSLGIAAAFLGWMITK